MQKLKLLLQKSYFCALNYCDIINLHGISISGGGGGGLSELAMQLSHYKFYTWKSFTGLKQY